MVFDSRQVTILPTYPPLLDRMRMLQEWEAQADRIAAEIEENIDRYEQIQRATGVPRFFVAALHHMECSGSFSKHLANGDPITAPTVNVPAGIPAGTWESCAIDIIRRKDLDDPDLDWEDRLKWVWRAEAWNGWGYRIYHPEVPTPYLWSGTSVGRPGKYVADGEWDAGAVSKQLGCVAIWQKLGVFNQRVAHMDLQGSSAVETPVGVLKIGVKTWLKASTKPAKDLAPTDKCLVHPDQLYPIYDRLPDTAGHYHVKLKSGGALRDIYCYSLHGSIAMNEDAEPDEIGSDLPEKETQVVSIDPTDKKLIQEHLVRIGLLSPPADGKWGSQSASAWRAFRRVCGDEGDAIEIDILNLLAKHKSASDLDFKPKVNDAEHAIAVKIIRRMVALNFPINVSMGSDKPTYNIAYVSGTNPDGSRNDNRIDDWNDLRFLIQVAADGTVLVPLCKLATIDAGYYWRNDPMNPLGTAQVDLDQYLLNCHCVGRHGSKQYPAIVQVGYISITRDLNAKGLRDAADKAYRGNDYGMNQHHGYDRDRVGIMSAGCFVGRSIAGHEQFMALLRKDRRYVCNNGFAWSTAILDGTKI